MMNSLKNHLISECNSNTQALAEMVNGSNFLKWPISHHFAKFCSSRHLLLHLHAAHSLFWQKSSYWVKIRLHTENQLPSYSISGLKVAGRWQWWLDGWCNDQLQCQSNLSWAYIGTERKLSLPTGQQEVTLIKSSIRKSPSKVKLKIKS